MTCQPIKILLVEDNPGDVELMLAAFEEAKLSNSLNVAEDGQEALDYIFQRGEHQNTPQPDIVLLDINLPKVNGIEVLKQIRQDESTKSIPVVMLTSSEADRDIISSYAHFANSYITKPVDIPKFLLVAQSIDNFWLAIVKRPDTDH